MWWALRFPNNWLVHLLTQHSCFCLWTDWNPELLCPSVTGQQRAIYMLWLEGWVAGSQNLLLGSLLVLEMQPLRSLPSISGWLTNTILYIHTWWNISHKNKWNSDTCYMDEPWRHCATWKKPDTKGQILYDFMYVKYLEWANPETEHRLEVTGSWKEELFQGIKTLGNSGDSCMTLWA